MKRKILFTLLILGIFSQVLPFITTNELIYKFSQPLYNGGLLVFILGSPIWIIMGLRHGLKFPNDDTNTWLILLIPVMTIGAHFFSNKVLEYTSYHSIEKSKPLINAIENFQTENGKYPDNLELIIPTYIEDIPEPFFANVSDFRYSIKEGEFILGFDQKTSPLLGGHKQLFIYYKFQSDIVEQNLETGSAQRIPSDNKKYADWVYRFWY